MKIKQQSQSTMILWLAFFGLLWIGIGVYLTPSLSILIEGVKRISLHISLLESDYLAIGGSKLAYDGNSIIQIGESINAFGAAFISSGLLYLIALASFIITKTKIKGIQIAALFMMIGFGMFGKSLLNVWGPFFGTLVYAKLHKRPIQDFVAIGWFTTSIAPVGSSIAYISYFRYGFSLPVALMIGLGMGLLAGYLVTGLAMQTSNLHKGFSILNVGMAAGIGGFLIQAFIIDQWFPVQELRSGYNALGLIVEGQNQVLAPILLFYFIAILIFAIMINGGLSEVRRIIFLKKMSYDVVVNDNFALAMINFAVVGIASTLYVICIGGQINGPVIAAIFNAAAFAPVGVSIVTLLPITLGIFIYSSFKFNMNEIVYNSAPQYNLFGGANSRGVILAALIGCGMVPISARYGFFAGMLVGVLHVMLVKNVSILHSGTVLYNNGFSLGIVVTLCLPFFEKIFKKQALHYDKVNHIE